MSTSRHSVKRWPGVLAPDPCLMVMAVLSLVVVGCASTHGEHVHADTLYHELTAKSRYIVAQAVYAKPASVDRSIRHEQLAPLIVQEARPGAGEDGGWMRLHPKAMSSMTEDGHVLSNSRPTVYFSEGTAKLGSTEYDQLLYFWFYSGEAATSHTDALLRGVRVTVGLDGFPMVWEWITGSGLSRAHPKTRGRSADKPPKRRDPRRSHDAGLNVVFVGRSAEVASRAMYGPPLPGRRKSIERSWSAAPYTLVARVVEDGPVPMGPYVYLGSEDHEMLSVLCRCSPSQADSFIEEIKYDLVPAETLPGFDWHQFGSAVPLDRRLRWPSGL